MTNANTNSELNRCSMPEDDGGLADTVWTAGNYDRVAPNFYSMAGILVDRLAVTEAERVLDIGCGTGTVAITAARRGADVIGVDATQSFLERASENAESAGVNERIDWKSGDAAALPFETDRFDTTLSNLGHMYADPATDAASELVRVTRPGGQIGFTAWTPSSLYPALASALLPYLDPDDIPDYSSPPFMWGDEATVTSRLDDATNDLTIETKTVAYPALSPEHFWETTRATSGTFRTLIETVSESHHPVLRDELLEHIEPTFDDRRNEVELEYLLVTGTVDTPNEGVDSNEQAP